MSSWLRRALLTAVFAGGALMLGGGVASAGSLGDWFHHPGSDGIRQSQSGSNSNSTTQGADADATTNQYNVNAPIAILSPGSNNGDVDQSNEAVTVAEASNWNDTDQSIRQGQGARSRGHGCGCRGGRTDQNQSASNSNSTDQDATATAETNQVNVNAPIAILSPGSNNGDVDQSNDAVTIAGASNWNETDQSIGQRQAANSGGHRRSCYCGARSGGVRQDQSATNDNSTYQDATSNATTNQYNVNAPIAILSPGSNNGDVSQSNDATTIAWASNSNSTDQGIHQRQGAKSKGSSCCWGSGSGRYCTCPPADHGKTDQSQDATNSNQTDQSANATAETNQKNWNTPVSILSPSGGCGCGHHGGGGDVDQSNSAFTGAFASNWNDTEQAIRQGQRARA